MDQLREAVKGLQACIGDVVGTSTYALEDDLALLEMVFEELTDAEVGLWEEIDKESLQLVSQRGQLSDLQEELDSIQVEREQILEGLGKLAGRISDGEVERETHSLEILRRHCLSSTEELGVYRAKAERLEEEISELGKTLEIESRSVHELRSSLKRDRMKRDEESRRRQKWRTEVGSRLRTSSDQLRDLQKDHAGLIDMCEMKAEHSFDWQERGEAAVKEIEMLQIRAEEAEQAVKMLETVQKESSVLDEELSTLCRKAELTLPGTEQLAVDTTIQETIARALERRLKLAGETVAELEQGREKIVEVNLSLQKETEELRKEKSALEARLSKKQDINIAREQALSEGNQLIRFVNGTLSRWLSDQQAAIYEDEDCSDEVATPGEETVQKSMEAES
mmetsp:Transcript_19530/g.77834  ORF Transcript_19530/g.77834 Transcript_19530/m.77834 type:complete len:395 (-) Transcript_19530:1417-2601(-)|eukprot:CAMPEP_0113962236 /NCGR_PEP_ID=MMETSP0011_2-20120614/5794_1 /TAXON_ID=101924 /ORGANISM="Rhodosorus marinus" /LENGTH=394 /DNA_ID=CAMNT_0000974049 /DNA_START=297 /DNA_END=1481 /DNA_ORIENTATION=- /assembly_acc=CAM_ASM_000156